MPRALWWSRGGVLFLVSEVRTPVPGYENTHGISESPNVQQHPEHSKEDGSACVEAGKVEARRTPQK